MMELKEMQDQKRAAWIKAHEMPLPRVEGEEVVTEVWPEAEGDTDREDEMRETNMVVVRQDQRKPIIVRGKATEPYDSNLDFDVTNA